MTHYFEEACNCLLFVVLPSARFSLTLHGNEQQMNKLPNEWYSSKVTTYW